MRYLLLHGFTGTPDSVAGLQAPNGSVAPPLGGHLETEATGSYWNEVERLAAFGAAHDCQGLFGYSLGGRFALGILARYPARFAHAVIVSAHPGLKSDAEREARRDGDARFVAILRERGLTGFVDAWQALPLWASQGALSEATKLAQRQQRLRHQAEGLAQSLIQHGLGEMPDLRPQLAWVLNPVDIVVGARDVKFAELGRELAELLPRATLTVVPGAGHNLLLESPALVAGLLVQGNAP